MTRWNQKECSEWFVSARKPDLSELSRISNVPFSTLKRWRSVSGWVQLRSEFQDRLSAQSREKAIEKSADLRSDLYAQLEREHLDAYTMVRHIATIRAGQLRQKYVALQLKDELSDTEVKAMAIDLKELEICAAVIDRCVRGERLVVSAEYADLNKAVEAVTRVGLKIVVPSDSSLLKFGISQVDDRKSDSVTDLD